MGCCSSSPVISPRRVLPPSPQKNEKEPECSRGFAALPDVPGVYVLTNELFGSEYKKIGMSAVSLRTRIRSYNTYSPVDYKVFAVFETANARTVEKAVHEELRDYRKPKNKEWFLIEDDQMMIKVIENAIQLHGRDS